MNQEVARRHFLRFVAGSPLLATPAAISSLATLLASTSNQALAQSYDALRGDVQKLDPDGTINSPAQDPLQGLKTEVPRRRADLAD